MAACFLMNVNDCVFDCIITWCVQHKCCFEFASGPVWLHTTGFVHTNKQTNIFANQILKSVAILSYLFCFALQVFRASPLCKIIARFPKAAHKYNFRWVRVKCPLCSLKPHLTHWGVKMCLHIWSSSICRLDRHFWSEIRVMATEYRLCESCDIRFSAPLRWPSGKAGIYGMVIKPKSHLAKQNYPLFLMVG